MSMLDNIKKQTPSGQGGDYLQEGQHVAIIDKVKHIETPTNGEAVVCELLVIQSTHPDIAQLLEGLKANGDENPSVAKTVMWMDKHPGGRGDFRRFVMDIAEATEEESGDVAVLAEIVGEKNPLAGTKVEVTSISKTTKSGNPFTKHSFALVK